MTIYVTKKTDLEGLQKMIMETSYSGERFIVQREDGSSIAIVPVEDVDTLEKIEESAACN